MKRLLVFVVALVACANVHAQAINCDGGQAKVQQVVEMPGKSATDIYKLAQRWVALTFHNRDKVVQTEIENELIRGDGFEPKRVKMAGVFYDLKYSFSVEVKDGKLRFTMYDMVSGGNSGSGNYPVEAYLCKPDGSFRSIPFQTKSVKESIEVFSAQLVSSLNSAMTEKKDDNW